MNNQFTRKLDELKFIFFNSPQKGLNIFYAIFENKNNPKPFDNLIKQVRIDSRFNKNLTSFLNILIYVKDHLSDDNYQLVQEIIRDIEIELLANCNTLRFMQKKK